MYKNKILVAAALHANPIAAIIAPIIVTARHPNRLVNELAIGPAPRVTPTNIEGIKDTSARLDPSKLFNNAFTTIPNEYIIPSAEINLQKWGDIIA